MCRPFDIRSGSPHGGVEWACVMDSDEINDKCRVDCQSEISVSAQVDRDRSLLSVSVHNIIRTGTSPPEFR
jgi:hypothetical protein